MQKTFFNETNLWVKDLKKGDYLIFNDEYMEKHDYEYSLFKYDFSFVDSEGFPKYLQCTEISDTYSNHLKEIDERLPDEDKQYPLHYSELRKVNLNSFELFRNYVINTSLIADNGHTIDGESIYALKIFNILEKTNNLDEFKAEIKSNNKELLNKSFFNIDIDSLGFSKEYFEEDWNDMFNNIKESYIDTLELLNGKSEDELINIYLSDSVYKFTGFTIEDSHIIKSIINDAINVKLV